MEVKVFENQREAEVAEANAELAMKKAKWAKDSQVQEANWELYRKQKAAEAILYEKEKQAEAQKAMAEATLYSRQQVADDELYAKTEGGKGTCCSCSSSRYLHTHTFWCHGR
ncbi:unnamed protein product [Lactuca virosa]|uniref:Flotillin-like n=1 Tax=Lactuca virosa TaxID=75947 RepID=A0AAU9NC26_9ASTR|nr:unnamed protein product [Lactuca virosa]